MKKLGISLLVLALVLSFVSANAAISARVGLNSATPTAVLVYGMNNIDLQFGYGINAISAPTGTAVNNGNIMNLGATYWINKMVGVNVGYNSTTASNTGTAATATTVLSLGLEGKAEIVKGLSLIASLPLYTSTSAAAGNSNASTTLLHSTAGVSAQFDLF